MHPCIHASMRPIVRSPGRLLGWFVPCVVYPCSYLSYKPVCPMRPLDPIGPFYPMRLKQRKPPYGGFAILDWCPF